MGCSKCHAGLGLRPTGQTNDAQRNNIDCLVCHNDNYRRKVVETAPKKIVWEPVQKDNPQAMLMIARDVKVPEKRMCLRCHAGSGGGMNYKRGDIESVLAHPSKDLGVHMGNHMICIQCHKFKNHKVMGAGTQISGTNHPEKKLQCSDCHEGGRLDWAALGYKGDPVDVGGRE